MNINQIKTNYTKHSDSQTAESHLDNHSHKLESKTLEVKTMNNLNQIAKYHLFDEFKQCTQTQFNGELKVINPQGKTWKLYYRLGKLVWSTGGNHVSRRLRRYINKYCPKVNINKLRLLSEHTTIDYWDDQIEDMILLSAEDANVEYWDYRILQTLYKSKQISQEQFCAITESTILEVLFDITQEANYSILRCQRNPDSILDATIISNKYHLLLPQIEKLWHKWVEAGLANFSPNSAPVVQKPKLLKKQLSQDVYQTVATLINGKYSIWDLAVAMQKNVLSIATWLLPLIRQGIMEFTEVPDLPLLPTVPQPKKFNTPLVACVDDSSQICEILEEVVTKNGMRFLKLQDPVEALPILIQTKPDFIFLDLIMPVLSGYELCRHLRRSNSLSKTPIVMLTASDGAFDKVRSKLFGATDFINKPVDKNTVINVIHQYLSSHTETNHKNTNTKVLEAMTT